MGKGSRNAQRQAILDELRAKQRREDRRRNLWTYGGGGLAVLILVAVIASVVVTAVQQKAAQSSAAQKPIAGVQSFSDLSRNHTTAQVRYPQDPPVGGDHAPVWLNCGAYTRPINVGEAVHSLEHGAVWVTYQPGLPPSDVDTLTQQAETNRYELISPYPGLPARVVASAWGVQLQLNDVNDPRLGVFLKKYLQGSQSPEPGAPCTGGATG